MEGYLVSIAIQVAIYLLLTIGLNLHYGFTGLINFGQVAFYCVGAYASALVASSGLGVGAGLVAAALVGALAALPLGALTLRLRAEYLAIVTLGFAETVRLIALNEVWLTNGAAGLAVPRPFAGTGTPLLGEGLYLALLVIINAAVIGLVLRLVRGPLGRLMQAVRDREHAVTAIGKTPAGVKRTVLMLGAALGGLAGGLQAHYIGFLSPDQFAADVTFFCWMAMIIGGTGSIAGSVAGTVILLGFIEASRFLHDIVPGLGDAQIAHLRLAMVGLMLILFMLYRPDGLIRAEK